MCNNSCKKNVSCTVAGCFSCRHSCCCHSCCCHSHCYHDVTVGCNISQLCNNQGQSGNITTGTYTWVNPNRTYRCCRCGHSYILYTNTYTGTLTTTWYNGQTITGGAIANGGITSNGTVSIPTVWTSGNITPNINSSLQQNSGPAQAGTSEPEEEDDDEGKGCNCEHCR